MHKMLLQLALPALYLATNVLNNVGVQQMGYYMPLYSTFLLYGPTAMYTLAFFFIALLLGELEKEGWTKVRQHWKLVLGLGILTSLNGIFAQIAIPFVAPEITALITQISTPVTWICAPILIRDGKNLPTVLKVVAFLTILFGMLFGGLYSIMHGSGSSSSYKNSYWILVALGSAIPTSFETIYQEQAYRVHKMPIFLTLTLYNLVSFVPYFLWMFTTTTSTFGTCVEGLPLLDDCPNLVQACSFSEVWSQQLNSFRCYFGESSVQCCAEMSPLWTSLFVLGYVASFATASYLLKREDGSNVVANLSALTAPLVSVFFYLPEVVSGPSYTHFKWWVMVGFGFLLLGNVIYVNFGDLKVKWNVVLFHCFYNKPVEDGIYHDIDSEEGDEEEDEETKAFYNGSVNAKEIN